MLFNLYLLIPLFLPLILLLYYLYVFSLVDGTGQKQAFRHRTVASLCGTLSNGCRNVISLSPSHSMFLRSACSRPRLQSMRSDQGDKTPLESLVLSSTPSLIEFSHSTAQILLRRVSSLNSAKNKVKIIVTSRLVEFA
jgi:hypothetical protein